MPFAQFHYPFENQAKFEQNFPGDFIAEYVGQVRAWFYYLHAVSVGLFGKNSFNNVIVTGTLAGNDGRKMSKSFGNYTDPNELMDQYSADSLRFLLLSSPVLNGEDFSLQDKDVADVARKLTMVWNMYDFFTLYAEVDDWEWNGRLEDPTPELTNPLDQWIVARLHQLVHEVEQNMDRYDLPNATKPIVPFIEDASNWYVRRSRRRFWKSAKPGEKGDADKQAAYKTLHYVLVQLAHVLAPFTPFLAEELFLKLTGNALGESVHLRDWPKVGHANELVLGEMTTVRTMISEGLAQRAAAGIKVRQPLASAAVVLPFSVADPDKQELQTIIEEELNVKSAICSVADEPAIVVDLNLTDELKREGLMRDVIRHVQNARKNADLSVEDRIELGLQTSARHLSPAIDEFADTIKEETLATRLQREHAVSGADAYTTTVTIEGDELMISLLKVH
jgi:isoleucyl-tRNA synthetase